MEVLDVKFYLRKRYFVTFLVFLSWIFLYLMRTNLSISIVDMTSDKPATVGNETIKAEFNWTSEEKGLLLSVFSWGYLTAPLGAMVANKYGPVLTFGIGITFNGMLSILAPTLIKQSLYVYLFARILEGTFEGLAGATFVEILKVWSSPSERTRTVATARCGFVVGSIIGFPICGTIAYYFNWRTVYYCTGSLTLMWSILWFSFIKNSPEDDRLMTAQEKKYLQQFNGAVSKQKIANPWRKILRSKVVWAYWNNRFVEAWLAGFLTYTMPLYIKDIHDVNVKEIGILAGIPQVTAAIGLISGSILADYLRNNKILSVSNVHRLFLPYNQLLGMVLLIAITVWRNFIGTIVCLSLLGMRIMVCLVSFDVLPVDMGGEYSCFIMAAGLAFTGVGVALSPLLMGLIVTHKSQWSIYFIVLSVLQFWGAIIYYLFGSGDLQPWAVSADSPPEKAEKGEQQPGKELESVKAEEVK